MSNTIATFKPPRDPGLPESKNMSITAFVGGNLYGDQAVQFTIGGHYACLTSYQVRELIECLEARLDGLTDYQATSPELGMLINAAGRDVSGEMEEPCSK